MQMTKHADDMALVGRLNDEHSLSEYLLQIDALTIHLSSAFLNWIQLKLELMFGGEGLLSHQNRYS